MNQRFKCKITAALCCAGLLLMSACSSSSDSAENPASALLDQSSVTGEFTCGMTLDAEIDGASYSEITQTCQAQAAVDLQQMECSFTGVTETEYLDHATDSSETEYYTVLENDSPITYERHGSYRTSSSGSCSALSFLLFPAYIADEILTHSASDELLNGSVCSVYTASLTADDLPQPFFSNYIKGETSLSGCTVDARLLLYQDSGLPAQMELTYTGFPDDGIEYTDESGNTYHITALSYDIIYTAYGSDISIEVPQEFFDETPAVPELSESELSDGESYRIFNEAQSYCYSIAVPENSAFYESNTDSVSFYYFYSENDLEQLTYTLCSDYSAEQETDYALLLHDYYAQLDDVSDVSDSGLCSMDSEIGSLQYIAVYMTQKQENTKYHTVLIYAWMPSVADEADSFEILITEYNADSSELVDPEEELKYAVSAVHGWADY